MHYKMYIQCGEATMYEHNDLKRRVEEIVNKNKQTNKQTKKKTEGMER